MNRYIRNAGILFLLAGCSVVTEKQNVDLAARDEGGHARWTVVVPEKATSAERHAADELTNYVYRITGTKLPVAGDETEVSGPAVLIGKTRRTNSLISQDGLDKCGQDGFRLALKRGNLVVAGASDRGTLFGVYELLERFGGVRWYTVDCTKIPQSVSFEIPGDLDESQKPAFPVRITSWQALLASSDTTVRNKLSLSNGPDYLGGGSVRYSRKFGRCHTFAALVPVKEYFAQHPEFFSYYGGKRQSTGTQLCLTNKEMFEVAKRNLLADIAENYPKGIRYYGVSQNDWQGYCECEECARIDAEEGSHAGTNLRFVNALADEVAKLYPDVVIETLAYQYTQSPPKITRPRDNVLVCLCSIYCDFSKGLSESRASENVRFCRELEGWTKITPRIFIWDYTTDYSNYFMPFANVYTIRNTLAYLRDNHVEQVYAQGCSRGEHADWAELKAWLIAKWMWNPDLPANELIDDFISGYYGCAAAPIRRYFDALYSLERDETKYPMSCYMQLTDPVVTDEFLDAADEMFDEAERLAAGTEYLNRVKQARLSIDGTRVFRYIESVAGFNISRNRSKIDSNRWKFLQEVGRRYLANCELDGKMVPLSEDGDRHARNHKLLKVFIAHEPPTDNSDSIRIEEDFLAIPWGSGRGEYVDDPKADDGRALYYNNSHSSWTGRFKLQLVCMDPGVKCKIRFRVRIAARKRADPSGEVFWAGVYRPESKSAAIADISVKAGEVKDGEYAWYETEAFVPQATDFIWSAPGRYPAGTKPAHNGVYIDCFEVVRAE